MDMLSLELGRELTVLGQFDMTTIISPLKDESPLTVKYTCA